MDSMYFNVIIIIFFFNAKRSSGFPNYDTGQVTKISSYPLKKKKTVKGTFHSFHLVYPGVFLLAIKLGLRQPLRLLLQHLQSVQQLLQGGLILPPTGHGSISWLL